MVEVLIEDFGYDELKKPMVKSLEGVKFAGYVGCQTNRPFDIAGESTVAYGGSVKEAGLDMHIIQPTKLQEIAQKK